MRQCIRCGFPFKPPTPDDTKTNVCGSCADDLRQEEDTLELGMMAQYDEEEETRQMLEIDG